MNGSSLISAASAYQEGLTNIPVCYRFGAALADAAGKRRGLSRPAHGSGSVAQLAGGKLSTNFLVFAMHQIFPFCDSEFHLHLHFCDSRCKTNRIASTPVTLSFTMIGTFPIG